MEGGREGFRGSGCFDVWKEESCFGRQMADKRRRVVCFSFIHSKRLMSTSLLSGHPGFLIRKGQ